MLKYIETLVSFSEVPDEISLCINISNCPCHCRSCHSAYLAEDIGEELTWEVLEELIRKNKGISCVCFMGGDSNPKAIEQLAIWMKLQSWFRLKVAWYSGRQYFHPGININHFDYIKIGPYIPELGGLDKETTNQIMYKIEDGKLTDITYRFRHDFKSSV